MGYLQKDLAALLDAPASSTSFLVRRLGIEPDDQGGFSYAAAVGLVAARELRERGMGFSLAGAAARGLREEVPALIRDPERRSWLLLDHDGDMPACRIAPDAETLIDAVRQDDIVIQARPLAERALAAIRDAKKAKREVAN